MGVSGEIVNKYHVLHSPLLLSYAHGTFSSPTGVKPFQAMCAHTVSSPATLLPNGHGKKTATFTACLLSSTSPLHLLPQLI